VLGLYKVRTCSLLFSSVDLKKTQILHYNFALWFKSLHSEVLSGRSISLMLKSKSFLSQNLNFFPLSSFTLYVLHHYTIEIEIFCYWHLCYFRWPLVSDIITFCRYLPLVSGKHVMHTHTIYCFWLIYSVLSVIKDVWCWLLTDVYKYSILKKLNQKLELTPKCELGGRRMGLGSEKS